MQGLDLDDVCHVALSLQLEGPSCVDLNRDPGGVMTPQVEIISSYPTFTIGNLRWISGLETILIETLVGPVLPCPSAA